MKQPRLPPSAGIIKKRFTTLCGVGGSGSPTAPLVDFLLMGRYMIDLKRMGEIMSDPNLTDAEKVLLYIISDYYQYCMNFGKECIMSYSVLRQRTGWWNDKIQKHIESLREKDLISVETHKVNGNQNTPMVFTSTIVGYSENHNTYSENHNTYSENRNTYSENRNTNEEKSEYECSENRNTSVPKIGKNNNTLQYNQYLSNGEEGCSFPEKNQKQPSSEKYNIDEYSEIEKKVIAIMTKK